MIKWDRELLVRMATVNASLGEVLLRMLNRQDGGRLRPDDLRDLGEAYRQLGTDMVRQAEKIERTIGEAPDPSSGDPT